MLHSPNFTVVLDACVLYPAPVRDLMLSFGAVGLLKPKWSHLIQQEWLSNLLKNRPELKEKQLNQTVEAMNIAFPDANVDGFEHLIQNLELPDIKDRHVLACAIHCQADVLTTFNTKDFPSDYLLKFDVQLDSPDELIYSLLDLNPSVAKRGFEQMVKRLKSPPMSKQQVADTLGKCGLPKSSKLLIEI